MPIVPPRVLAAIGLLLAPGLVAQSVRIDVGRAERAATLGLDEQLRALRVANGTLTVVVPATAPATGPTDVLVEVVWTPPAKDQKKGFAPAKVASSDAARAQRWLAAALAGEGEFGAVGAVAALPVEPAGGGSAAPLRLRLEFVTPTTGHSKARQFRHARKVVAAALADLGMLANSPAAPGATSATSPWPPGFPAGPAIALYDAEGAGGSGCENLERVVDATTLGHRLLPVCPEDIRDGGLRGLAGVVFPGGSGGGIAKALQPAGVAAVRAFVDGGGGYVGICAGAYLAGAGMKTYAALVPWQHTQPWAKGAAMLDVELTDEGKRLLGGEFATFTTRYHNGPVFPDVLGQSQKAGTRTQPLPLAAFASASKDKKGVVHHAMVGAPAIVADVAGKGRVLLISPHPESHERLDVLVARAIGWTLGLEPQQVATKPAAAGR
ncbi:MAG: hypothetical protein INH34_02190 [Phycisphaerales bacterium]|nr:hypothetical protein [Phycisphaerales bacterium]